MSNVRYVLGISGGKDSTALAVYLRQKYPSIEIEYYFCDTGKELSETYTLIDNLEIYLGKKIIRLNAVKDSSEDPFDHFLSLYGGFLPSTNARWCTRQLKLKPFEDFVADDLVVSFVAIRGDENREAYISKKSSIQSIFPFRENIWSDDVIGRVLESSAIPHLEALYQHVLENNISNRDSILEIVRRQLSIEYPRGRKLRDLLRIGVSTFNKVVFEFLKSTDYPLSKMDYFPIVENEANIGIEDVFRILKESGVGVPAYYEKIPFEVDGKEGYFSRSRSGCYFCFFQQKIEWVWLYEKHPDLFAKAMEYEKEGYTWMANERLENLIKPERVRQIKLDQLKRHDRYSERKSNYLLDVIEIAEADGCPACFI